MVSHKILIFSQLVLQEIEQNLQSQMRINFIHNFLTNNITGWRLNDWIRSVLALLPPVELHLPASIFLICRCIIICSIWKALLHKSWDFISQGRYVLYVNMRHQICNVQATSILISHKIPYQFAEAKSIPKILASIEQSHCLLNPHQFISSLDQVASC